MSGMKWGIEAHTTQTRRNLSGTSATAPATGPISTGFPIRWPLAVCPDQRHHVTPMTDRTATEEGTCGPSDQEL